MDQSLPSPVLRLPLEIREIIYAKALDGAMIEWHDYLSSRIQIHGDTENMTPLLRVSRSVRRECLPIYRKLRTICVNNKELVQAQGQPCSRNLPGINFADSLPRPFYTLRNLRCRGLFHSWLCHPLLSNCRLLERIDVRVATKERRTIPWHPLSPPYSGKLDSATLITIAKAVASEVEKECGLVGRVRRSIPVPLCESGDHAHADSSLCPEILVCLNNTFSTWNNQLAVTALEGHTVLDSVSRARRRRDDPNQYITRRLRDSS